MQMSMLAATRDILIYGVLMKWSEKSVDAARILETFSFPGRQSPQPLELGQWNLITTHCGYGPFAADLLY
jgi:hypothetical protein